MPDDAAIVEKLKAMVGTRGKPQVLNIEKGKIRNIAEAIGDENPLWRDDAYARQTRWGGIVAPPGFLIAHLMSYAGRPSLELPGTRRLDGGGEWEFIKPIRPGDTITSVTTFSGIEEAAGKLGKMYILSFATTHTNRQGEMVATGTSATICY